MKKTLLFASALMVLGASSAFAQEERVDMTNCIVNAGFDEDLTFGSDGRPAKEITATTRIADSRAIVWEAADGSLYSWPKEDDSEGHIDRFGNNSWYGFIGRIAGWEVTNTTESPAWMYFGSVPYDVTPYSLAVGGDGTKDNVNDAEKIGTIESPGKPEGHEGDDNKAFLLTRAGWGAKCTYKQVVSLPCAQYELEYWTINTNKNSTADAKDLTNITCRKDVFKDDEGLGLSSKEWTKHTVSFTPTSTFTIEIGYQAANSGSGGNPWLIFDGIKLYKIGEADRAELLQADFNDAIDSLWTYDRAGTKNTALSDIISNFIESCNELLGTDDPDQMQQAVNNVNAFIKTVDAAMPTIEQYDALIAKMQKLLDSETQYPGYDALKDAAAAAEENIINATSIEALIAVVEGMQKDVNDYYMSQTAYPADYTFLVKNNTFTKAAATPEITYNADGTVADCVYPNGDSYETGKAPADGTSEGWYKAGTSDGDQRLNYTEGRVCWNAWRTGTADLAVAQDLSDLPNGYYTVSAEMCTQPDYVSNQHVYAKSVAGTAESPALTEGNMGAELANAWTVLTTERVAVIDGKLTIGASGSAKDGSTNQTGWFCVTNFRLFYNGPITDAEIADIYAAKLADTKKLNDSIYFAADKASFADSLAQCPASVTAETVTGAFGKLQSAETFANASAKKYKDVLAGSLNDLKDRVAGEGEVTYTGSQVTVAGAAIAAMEAAMAAASATYTKMDSLTAILRQYRDNYLPVLGEAEALELTDATAKEAVKVTIEKQVAKLAAVTSLPAADTFAPLIEQLKQAIAVATAAETLAKGGSDVTAFIVNPTVDNTNGWTIDKPVGDGNGVKTGQQYDGDAAGGYFDSYNSTKGAVRFTASQTITNIPNGVYKLRAMQRTSGEPGNEGTYLFAINGTDTLNAVIAAAHLTLMDSCYMDETLQAGEKFGYPTDAYGPIWKEAYDITSQTEGTAMQEAIAAANSGKGRGWFYNELTIEVTGNALTIGFTCDSVFTAGHKDTDGKACVPFTGTWLSADNFTLELLENKQPGFNPATAIQAVATEPALNAADNKVYGIDGRRVSNISNAPAGIYVVRQNGAARKVLKK